MRLEEEIKQKKFASEYQKMYINILFTSSWLTTKNAHLLKPFGISQQQFNILRILKGQHPKPASVGLLTDRMIDKMSNASRLVEKLRLKGYVERTTCENDRRRVDVVITEAGLKLVEQASESMKAIQNDDQPITQEEAKTLNDILDKLRS